jgi:hypothetical protein
MVQLGKRFGYACDPANGVDKSVVSFWEGEQLLWSTFYEEGKEFCELMASFYKEPLLKGSTDDELEEELRRRGYSGVLKKTEIRSI